MVETLPKLRFVDFMCGRTLYANVVHPDYKLPITIRISGIDHIDGDTLVTDSGNFLLTELKESEIMFISERLANTVKEVTD